MLLKWNQVNAVATRRLAGIAGIVHRVVPMLSLLFFVACAEQPRVSQGNTPQQVRAMAMWQERCKKSGEFIHRTVDGVEAVYLVNVRTHEANRNFGEQPADQFRLSDPYGHDSTDDEYVLSFIHGFYRPEERAKFVGVPPRVGYSYVEAIDPKDGKLYRFTARVEEPWQRDKSYLKGYTRFSLDRAPIGQRTARYGVKFEDISTREERQNWIAGSSLKVINLETGEILGERVGYMVDWAQGSRAGARAPWLFAADNACPSFDRGAPSKVIQPSFSAQSGQSLDFTEKVLIPIQSTGSVKP